MISGDSSVSRVIRETYAMSLPMARASFRTSEECCKTSCTGFATLFLFTKRDKFPDIFEINVQARDGSFDIKDFTG